MMRLTEEGRKSFEEGMERRYGITADILYAEGIEERMRRAAERLEERGIDPAEKFMDDTFMGELFHDRSTDDDEFIDETFEIAERLGYDI